MSYIDRLQPKITLTSPLGTVFDAKWVGGARTQEKELGIFKTPGIKGVIAQDLDVRGMSYPLTIFFDGPDNDLEAEKFMVAASENGTWEVVHPTKGQKTLQFSTFTENIEPVTGGNVTQFTIEAFEIIDQQGAKSSTELAAAAIAQAEELNQVGADQLNQVVSLDTADKAGKFKTAVNNVVKSFDETLSSITETVAEVNAQAESIKRGIDAAFEGVTDVLAVAAQVQALTQLPAQIVTDIKAKIETYDRFVESIFGDSPDSSTPANVNTAAVQELALTAAIGAVGVSIAVTPLSSRQSAIESTQSNIDLFTTITNGLDESQELYADQLLSRSYFSQSQSFPDTALTVALTSAFLIKSSFDLSTEKRITLTKAENPVMIAMRERKGTGDNDENIDAFYSENQLTGSETKLLQAGRVVVVYV